MSPPRSTLTARIPSPLPQEAPRSKVQPVSVVNAFYQFLPPKSLSFFKRSYFSKAPRPLIASAGISPVFPRILPLARIKMPTQQVLVFQDIVFTAYRASNIDPNDYTPLTPFENKRLLGFVGYSFTIGGRSVADANTNVGSFASSGGAAGGGGDIPVPSPANPVSSATSTYLPYQGSIAEGTHGFAAYGMPGQVIEAAAVFLSPPPFEIGRFTVDISGYLLNETHYNELLGNLR